MSERVLLVDDDPTTRLILKRRLRASGYRVSAVESGDQALAMLKWRPFSLIVSDWMMPGMDGLELCRRIKSEPDFSPNYFIMMTVKGEKSHCVEGLEAGADDYLPKPVDEGELLARLRAGQRVIARQKNLQSLAITDPLTGLLNRRCFEEDLESEIKEVRRHGYPFSLLLLDLNNFKQINDSWGHAKGDEVLKIFGEAILERLRGNDRAYRIGGDEFAVILRLMWELEAEKVGIRLRESFARHMARNSEEMPCSCSFSFGLATVYPGMAVTKEQVIASADKNLYFNKKDHSFNQGNCPGALKSDAQSSTVLVVDDEPMTRKVLHRGLSAAGYRVLLAENGESCLDLVRKAKPEVVVLDWIMPGMDGMEVCRSIRMEEGASLPYIIMLTIVRGANSRFHAMDVGVDDFISKPIDMNELTARVRIGFRMQKLKERAAGVDALKGTMRTVKAALQELVHPLHSLQELSETLLTRADADAPVFDRLKVIQQETERLGELAQRMDQLMNGIAVDY